jgi:hypothetical protein
VDAVLGEARRLADAGFREIVVSGVNLGHTGAACRARRTSGTWWSAMDRALAVVPPREGPPALKLPGPGMLGAKALDTLAACPEHMPASARVPAKRRRRGARGLGQDPLLGPRHRGLRGRPRRVWPLSALGADLLTGFPGESEAAFRTTLDFCSGLAPDLCPRVPLFPASGIARGRNCPDTFRRR